MVKRLFDIVCAAVALVVTAPLIGLAAIGIKLSDHGPVFYRARRVGYLGREFTMFKLRTMRYDGEGSRGAGGYLGVERRDVDAARRGFDPELPPVDDPVDAALVPEV